MPSLSRLCDPFSAEHKGRGSKIDQRTNSIQRAVVSRAFVRQAKKN